ncbi:hypothetical protein KUTeg_011818 [Tegillarca granosa]|uniref:Nuclease HARBI1 n=1 Tax=Tegillarca granosa TaxID=220873 RepID=A0ABQ9EXR3_TEGGR|nr:hypothetical protein KUTeg_011818 [Tegillarca granosa]
MKALLKQELESSQYPVMNKILQYKQLATALLYLFTQRSHIPRVTGFVDDVVPNLSTSDFISHYRIDRNTFHFILHRLAPAFIKDHIGGKEQIGPKNKKIFLWYMANQESTREASNMFSISMSTVHYIIRNVCNTFVQQFQNYKFQQIQIHSKDVYYKKAVHPKLKKKDYDTCNIPGIIGIIDGTHIRLSGALGGDQDYINRKHFPSMQLQG